MSNVGKVCDYLDYLLSLYICAFSNDWLIKMWPWRLLTKCFRACVWGNDISYNTYITVFWSGSMRRLSWHTWLRCRSSVRIEQRCRDLPLTTRTAALQRRERWTDGQDNCAALQHQGGLTGPVQVQRNSLCVTLSVSWQAARERGWESLINRRLNWLCRVAKWLSVSRSNSIR